MGNELAGVLSDKKAMSPLIATILLIAFAVALGTMIINLKIGDDKSADCSKITMIVSPYLCYADNMIKMSVKNTGEPVEAVTMKIVDDTASKTGPIIRELPDSKLNQNQFLNREITYAKTGMASVSLTASVKLGEKTIPCEKPALNLADLPDCQ
ncbi:MAG TPA: archaellin/type IV pilin N-terminal domain-containing protein [Candidatus Nanoarchaeia archaeon]|nr:archaellin/type IV pilin N-terminal domain-containing protein [Candidatus Nanoarchaeia archaeon]